MPLALLTLLLLPAVCQATKLISLVTKSDASKPPFEADSVDPVTGQFTQLVGLGNNNVPFSSALRDNNTLVYATLFNNLTSCLTTVDLSTGKVERGRLYESLGFFRVGFDTVTKQTFVVMYATKAKDPFFTLHELLPDQSLHQVTKTKFNHVRATTYSSSKHAFFLGEGFRHVVTVSTVGDQAGKVLYNVSVDLELSALVYDDTFGVLYAWGYDPDATPPNLFAKLVSLDYTTGKTLKTFYQSSFLTDTATSLPTCIDKTGATIYAFLFDLPNKRTVIHSLKLSSGTATQVPAVLYAETMNCL